MEEGTIATPWTIPDPQIELAGCQRYCYVNSAQYVYVTKSASASYAVGSYNYPQTMRAIPVVTIDMSKITLSAAGITDPILFDQFYIQTQRTDRAIASIGLVDGSSIPYGTPIQFIASAGAITLDAEL